MSQSRFSIKGMRCAGCAANIEKTIRSQRGVKNASVNFAAASLLVEWMDDAGAKEQKQAENAIKKLGFRVFLYKRESPGQELQERAAKEFRAFLLSASFTIVMVLLCRGVLPLSEKVCRLLLPLLTLPVLWAGREFFLKGIPALLRGMPDMDTLIAAGAGSAVAASLIKTAMGIDTGMYFHMAGMIITLILLGRTLEARARRRTFDAISSLAALAPPKAVIMDNGNEKEKDIDDLQPGDICVVLPGDSFPADCIVTAGVSDVDESMLTGEAMPVAKTPGSKVTAGTINRTSRLLCKVEASGGNTVLAGIIRIVEDAQADKPPVARIADTVAGYFAFAVLIAGAVVFAVWYFIAGFDTALQRALAVIVTACPCALGLATPAALIAGLGAAARKGILFKSGTALETASKVTKSVFDKTGTLTTGRPEVTGIMAVNVSRRDFLALAAGLEAVSSHPFARAVKETAEKEGVTPVEIEDAVVEAGGGVYGRYQGRVAAIGSWDFLVSKGLGKNTRRPEPPSTGTVICVALESSFAGIITMEDTLRESAKTTAAELHAIGISTAILSGDNAACVAKAAAGTGISEYHAALLPADKESVLQEYRRQGFVTAMIGDGINDAPALAAADMGVALASGTDIAIAACDAVLPSSDPAVLPEMFSLAKQVMRVIKQNLFWAFFYNMISIPVAAGILIPLGVPGVPPAACAAAMAVSSLTVVCNSLRLRHCR